MWGGLGLSRCLGPGECLHSFMWGLCRVYVGFMWGLCGAVAARLLPTASGVLTHLRAVVPTWAPVGTGSAHEQ